jgi:hypothetical protein
MHGRFAASVDDVRALAPSVLRHRILTNFNAEAEGVTSLAIIERLLETCGLRPSMSPWLRKERAHYADRHRAPRLL